MKIAHTTINTFGMMKFATSGKEQTMKIIAIIAIIGISGRIGGGLIHEFGEFVDDVIPDSHKGGENG